MISGLQLGLVDKASLSADQWVELLRDTYVLASIDNVQQFRACALNFPPLGSGEWFNLGRPLSLSKTRFDIPAFVFLNYRLAAQ